MGTRNVDLRALERVAAGQHDVFTTAQAEAHGYSKAMRSRRRRDGDWVQLLPGVASVVDEERLELAIEDCLRRGLFTVGQLEWRTSLRRGKGFAGSRVIADLVRRHGSTVSDSGWEVRVEHALAHCGLPRPRRQLAVDTSLGTLHVDLAYPGRPVVAFEYDSDRWHSGVRRRHADMRRRNALRAAGVTVVELNAALLRDGATFGTLVRSVLRAPTGQE